MRRKNKNGIEWLEFELFADLPEVVHAIFLRDMQDQQSMASVMGLDKIYASADQCHGKHVEVVALDTPLFVGQCDGLITHHKGAGLAISHADCQAAIFYDPIKKAIGNVHSGWRGNVQNIYLETVQKMQATYGTNPRDLLVGISPSLGPECSEFINYRKELPEHFWTFETKPTYFDLWQIARKQLMDAGVPENQIEIASICTVCNPNDFHSYRRDKAGYKNNITLIALRKT